VVQVFNMPEDGNVFSASLGYVQCGLINTDSFLCYQIAINTCLRRWWLTGLHVIPWNFCNVILLRLDVISEYMLLNTDIVHNFLHAFYTYCQHRLFNHPYNTMWLSQLADRVWYFSKSYFLTRPNNYKYNWKRPCVQISL